MVCGSQFQCSNHSSMLPPTSMSKVSLWYTFMKKIKSSSSLAILNSFTSYHYFEISFNFWTIYEKCKIIILGDIMTSPHSFSFFRVYYTSKILHADVHKVQEEWQLNFPVLNLDHNENLLKMDGFQAWADVVGLVFVMEQTFPPSPCKIQLTSDDKWRLERTCLL